MKFDENGEYCEYIRVALFTRAWIEIILYYIKYYMQ